ncbi:hypothetical protein [Serratia fonticola]|uniref:hypothetical protein n=1 Tax=Serratia fonticola TaxID=47917 RepID=UPI002DBF612E|nr:hypothetical protein [Serratia fonticola]MEB7885619.1 hypothetical protein [Serratia fonticola]
MSVSGSALDSGLNEPLFLSQSVIGVERIRVNRVTHQGGRSGVRSLADEGEIVSQGNKYIIEEIDAGFIDILYAIGGYLNDERRQIIH